MKGSRSLTLEGVSVGLVIGSATREQDTGPGTRGDRVSTEDFGYIPVGAPLILTSIGTLDYGPVKGDIRERWDCSIFFKEDVV